MVPLSWIEPSPIEPSPALVSALDGDRFLAEIMAHRGFLDPSRALAWLNPRLHQPAPLSSIPGLEPALDRLDQAVRGNERVWIWGDFDVDGQTSTAILVDGLSSLGLAPRYHIPQRSREGHGVNINGLERILAEGCDLLITCDTGITAFEALDWAQAQGLDVIVTDHHELGERLPPALAHITPRLLAEDHPMAGLPGAGAAYLLVWAALANAGREEEALDLADLAAMGIVADVATQTPDVRWLLQLGLNHLRVTRREGLQALYGEAGISPATLNEQHIGFSLAPRLNAIGRLGDANSAVELLTTRNLLRAKAIASDLESYNTRRRLETRQVAGAASAMLQRQPAYLDSPILILHQPEWPGGVVGLVAGQLAQSYGKPVILLRGEGDRISGSARSVEGVDITACISQNAALLQGFGGHPMAAGLGLHEENLPALRRGLAQAVQKQIYEAEAAGLPVGKRVELDAWLPLAQADLPLADRLDALAPFGPGFPGLVFADRNLTLTALRPLGREGDQSEHRIATLSDASGQSFRVFWWGGGRPAQQHLPREGATLTLAYSLRTSDYHGTRSAMLEWIDFETVAEPVLQLGGLPFQVTDLRRQPQPLAALERLRAEYPDLQVWAEGAERPAVNGKDRLELLPGSHLAIWHSPPGSAELRTVLEIVKPTHVIPFAVNPQTDQAQTLVHRLAGLVKYHLSHEGEEGVVDLTRLAAACAQTVPATRLALQWMAAAGHIRLEPAEGGDGWRISTPGIPASPAVQTQRQQQLQRLLTESAAYRRFFSQAAAIEVLRQ